MLNDEEQNDQRAAEVLEVEDEEQRQERMHSLFARLNAGSHPNSGLAPLNGLPQRPFAFGDRSTLSAGPPSDLLQRVQAFLPELAASNADLIRRARENPESVDIENVGDEERYIEMNLGLGVFDHRGEVPAGIPVADVDLESRMQEPDSDTSSDSEDDSSGCSSSSSDSSDHSTSSEGLDSDEDMVDSSEQKKDVRPKKPLPRRKANASKPGIVVLSETPNDPTPPS
ncbi:hypothetical protein PYCCODRAFT_1454133 [Trametes coccinea BRFM310]|uniref:Uncharacterized protein n=1 Tax=Trametes coccinea (strain BRFM310) TaxID=1353009 RepID=A0A1Y2IG09_TRAC3|nr:hypothetical protein PYCCODRAFT_1454133 [Trametes coccinea BRFM310]